MSNRSARSGWMLDPAYLSVLAVLFVQSAAGFYWAGQMSHRIETMEKAVSSVSASFVTVDVWQGQQKIQALRDAAQDERIIRMQKRDDKVQSEIENIRGEMPK